MAGGAGCLRVVLQSLGDDPYEQEDLQSSQGLGGQEQHIYPARAQPSFLAPPLQPFGTLV